MSENKKKIKPFKAYAGAVPLCLFDPIIWLNHLMKKWIK